MSESSSSESDSSIDIIGVPPDTAASELQPVTEEDEENSSEGEPIDPIDPIAAEVVGDEAYVLSDTPVVDGEIISGDGNQPRLSRLDVAYLSCFFCVALLLLPLTVMLICFICAYGAERLAYDLEMWASFEKPTKKKRKKVTEKIDATTWDEEKHPSTCEICLTAFTRDDQVAESMNDECPHVFHVDCIVPWLAMKYHRNPSCPVCRRTYVQTKT